MGLIGPLIIFFFTMIATIVIGGIAVICAARTFLNVIEDTAAGNDEIHWPNDQFADWLLDPFFLIYLLALPVVPAWAVIQLTAPEWLETPLGPWPLIFGTAWLLFPIMLFSALSSVSRFQVLHLGFLRGFVCHPFSVLVFYFSTGVVLLAGGGCVYCALFMANQAGYLAVVGVAACVLVHGRLFGRMGWLVGFHMPPKEPSPREPSPKEQPPEQPLTVSAESSAPPDRPRRLRKKKRAQSITVLDPWAVPKSAGASLPAPKPPADENEWDPDKKPYTFAADPAPTSPREEGDPAQTGITTSEPGETRGQEEDEWTPNKKPYGFSNNAASYSPPKPVPAGLKEAVSTSPPVAGSPGGNEDEDGRPFEMLPSAEGPAQSSAPELPKPDRIEMLWMANRKAAPPPRWPLFSGVWTFPVSTSAYQRLLILSGMFLLVAFLLRFLLMIWNTAIRGALA